jgi:hypothetical protein
MGQDGTKGEGITPSVGVVALGVPMSPGLVNVRHRTHIDQGLISTERNTPPEGVMPSPFCVLAVQR